MDQLDKDPKKDWSEEVRSGINRVFHILPQRPHYAPFSKYQSLTSDSIKKGLDFGFYNLTHIVTSDSIHPCTFLQNLEDYRSIVSDFEEFGFNVTKLTEILSARKDIANAMIKLEAKEREAKEIESLKCQHEKDIEKLKNKVILIKRRKTKVKKDSREIMKQFVALAKAPWN